MNISICLIELDGFMLSCEWPFPVLPAVNDSIAVLHFCGEAMMKKLEGMSVSQYSELEAPLRNNSKNATDLLDGVGCVVESRSWYDSGPILFCHVTEQ